MDYKLAKQLKDAGFKQNENKSTFANLDSGDLTFEKEMVYVPTLPELIDACGKGFRVLSRVGDEWVAESYIKWEGGTGKTPIVAVAKLWLKLNE